jgi:tetratricopeptide (TPR) repeat protein
MVRSLGRTIFILRHPMSLFVAQRNLSKVGLVGLLAAAVLILTLSYFGPWNSRNISLQIPTPPQPEKLEPQLRAFLAEKVERVKNAPGNFEHHSVLGLAYASNGLWTEAGLSFSNACVLAPKQPLALMYVAVSAQEQGDTDRAMKLYKEVTENFPKFPQAYSRLGDLALRLGNHSLATSAFDHLTQLAPNEWRGWTGLAEIALAKDNPGEALPLLERSLRLEPSAGRAHYLLGQAFRLLGKTNDAAIELALGKDHPEYPMPDEWNSQASAYMKTTADQIEIARNLEMAGRADEAVNMLGEALTFQPKSLTLMNNLAVAYIAAGRPGLSVPILEHAMALDTNFVAATITLSQAYHLLGRTNEALACAEHAIAALPQAIEGHLAKANVLLDMEDDRGAVEAIERARSLDPQNADLHLELGDLYWRNLAETNRALSHYEQAIQLNPVLPVAYQKFAEFLESIGEVSRAKTNNALAERFARATSLRLSGPGIAFSK